MEQREFYRSLGAKIASRRRDKGLTQSAMAKRLGLSRDILANIETGRQNVHVQLLVEIANALGARSIETLLPANLWLRSDAVPEIKVEMTGAPLSPKQKQQVAGIFELMGD